MASANYLASSLRIDAEYANAAASLSHYMSSSPDCMSSPFSSTSDAAMHSLASSSSLSSASSNGEATTPPSMIKSAPATSTDLKHKPHKCDVCGSSFARKVHLQRHSLRHQVCKPYCCELCGKCFSRQDSLVRHHRLLHDGVNSSSSAIAASSAQADKKSPAKKLAASKRASTGSILTMRTSSACLRCSSAGTACDGQQPCARCTANQGAESCCYASPSSSPSKRVRRRHDSVATSSSSISMLAEEDEGAWTSAHGVRRDTSSSVSSSSSTMSELLSPVTSAYGLDDSAALSAWGGAQTMIVHPHPFELPLQDSLLMAGFGGNDVKSLHPQQLHDGGLALPFDARLMSMLPTGTDAGAQPQQQTAPFSQSVMPMFDWSSLMHGHQEQQQLQQQLQLQAQQLSLLQQHIQAQANMAAAAAAAAKQPFSGAASNKSLNATLLGGHESSSYPSPTMYGVQNALLAAAAYPQQPSSLSLNLTAAQATDNWDGFMRQLSSPYNGTAANVTSVVA